MNVISEKKVKPRIFDSTKREYVETWLFLKDENNVIIIVNNDDGTTVEYSMNKKSYPTFKFSYVEDKYVGTELDKILISCGPTRSFVHAREEIKKRSYVNMEAIGIKFSDAFENVGIIVDYNDIDLFRDNQIIELYKTEESIPSTTTLSFLQDPVTHGAVSALHCQSGYANIICKIKPVNFMFKYIPTKSYTLISTDKKYILQGLRYNQLKIFENLILDNSIITLNSSLIELISEMINYPERYLLLNEKQKKKLNQLGYFNFLRYPSEYYDIYKEEKTNRNLEGNSKLINITNYPIDVEKFNNTIRSTQSFNNYNYTKFFNEFNAKFDKFKKNIIIAGGAALAMHQKNFDIADIDIFFHSCNSVDVERIIREFIYFYRNKREFLFVKDSKDAITIHFRGYENIPSIQFIKRIYNSPSEIIHGFDIDCSCIYMTVGKIREFFCTERCLYSLTHRCNIVNFDRLSPSYEYRICKYSTRKFDIYIPFMKFYLDNLDLDFSEGYLKGSNIISRFIFLERSNIRISDYSDEDTEKYDRGDVLDFNIGNSLLNIKTHNPNEQSIGSFHRIVLEDIREWYPHIRGDDEVILPKSNKIIILEPYQYIPLYNRDFVCSRKPDKLPCFNIMDKFPNLLFYGNYTLSCYMNLGMGTEINIIYGGIKDGEKDEDKYIGIIEEIKELFIEYYESFEEYGYKYDYVDSYFDGDNGDVHFYGFDFISPKGYITLAFNINMYLESKKDILNKLETLKDYERIYYTNGDYYAYEITDYLIKHRISQERKSVRCGFKKVKDVDGIINKHINYVNDDTMETDKILEL
jgi:hypothetical protein